ncbi:MAG: Uncharacterised protein [Flavobacteriales bacterium]|jgi:hypothetical protein|nr:MAG: DUF2007 domain-containing protein [Flavobacteriales bacterium]RPF73445.1 MAG: DUF2007 domain-containing protein [Thiotrichales bacterium TMED285]CAI8268403.1 MAG: Uncharacterised protein [Flavobacteriales bacterium]|tara:strand:+ start:5978 stop:6181 length:204 start_codon:yes stop_codon:yes gene_type:complete
MTDSFSLLYTGSLIDVQRLKGALEDINIFPIIKDETESARLAGFGAPTMMQQLWVLATELEKAKTLL